jgi:hypothetical protein
VSVATIVIAERWLDCLMIFVQRVFVFNRRLIGQSLGRLFHFFLGQQTLHRDIAC